MGKKILFALVAVMFSMQGSASQDPTAPLGWSAPNTLKQNNKQHRKMPQLQSIVCHKNSPCIAVLNDQVVEEGQLIGGYIVKSITLKEVIVARGKKQWPLTLFALEIKK